MPCRSHVLVATLLLLAGCSPLDGPIFTDLETIGETDATAEGGDAAGCAPAGPITIVGGSSNWTRECGELCDQDWCWCDACGMTGPLVRLSAGVHTVNLDMAAQEGGTYVVTLGPEDGPPLLDETFDFTSNPDKTFEFVVPPGCSQLFLDFRQAPQTSICSRLYGVRIDLDT